MKMTLPCLNCHAETDQEHAKFFAGVFLCGTCHDLAVHFHEKLERELKFLLTVSKESIRVALVQGKFILPEALQREPSKRAVLEEILRMEEARAQEPPCTSPMLPEPSPGASTLPSARTLAALAAASSPKPSPQG